MSKLEITSLPLSKVERAQFVETANKVFEAVLRRLDLENPDAVRELWDAEDYVDNAFLSEDMLPISVDYAHSLIDAFMVHYVIGLIGQAQKGRAA